LEERPNIVFIIADDLGWNDLSFYGAEFPTPNIDLLFNEGYVFQNYYVHQTCAPSRVAFLSMRYSWRYGLNGLLHPGTAAHVPTSETLYPELMRQEYSTYLAGKWNLGYASTKYLPTSRGFDEWFGYMQGSDWTDHVRNIRINGTTYPMYNMWYDGPMGDGLTAIDRLPTEVVSNLTGYYNTSDITHTSMITNYAVNIIQTAPEPFLLQFSPQEPHAPLEGPETDSLNSSLYDCNLTNSSENRITYCTQVSLLDETVGLIVDSLKKQNLWDNTYIIFSTDNGGASDFGDRRRSLASASSNYPFRGMKATQYEGGIHGVFTIAGGALPDKYIGQSNYDLHHAVDVPVTMLSLAGYQHNGVDGIDMLSTAKHNELSLMIDVENSIYVYRKGDMKYIQGNFDHEGWYSFGWIHEDTNLTCLNGCVFNLTADIGERVDLINTTFGAQFAMETMEAINATVHSGDYMDEPDDVTNLCWEAVYFDPGYLTPWSDDDVVNCTFAAVFG